MPLESEAQRRYLWATDPELAQKFEDETPKDAKLPKRKRKSETAVEETVELKDFSEDERKKLTKEHEAMPGGGFPIRNGSDLRNAIQAVGRAKNPAAARAWIVKRAKELKLTDSLPQSWELAARVDVLELAVLALGQEEFGDTEGHPFRGNQWSDVSGRGARENAEADQRTRDALTPRLKRPGESDRSFEQRKKDAAARNDKLLVGQSKAFPGEKVLGSERGEKAMRVALKSFDNATPQGNGLPVAADLRTGSPVAFERAMGYEKPGNQHGLWVMEHQESGTRVEGTGKRTEVEAGIKEQYPKSGTWTYAP